MTARGHGAAETAHVHRAAGTGSMGAALPGTSTAGSRGSLLKMLRAEGSHTSPASPSAAEGEGSHKEFSFVPHSHTWLLDFTVKHYIK